MPDKSFEEQVREELSGLRMKPDNSVWEQVALRLEKRRKRRWGAWLFILLFCLLGAAGWWLVEEGLHNEVASLTTQSKEPIMSKEIAGKQQLAVPPIPGQKNIEGWSAINPKQINSPVTRSMSSTVVPEKNNTVAPVQQPVHTISGENLLTVSGASKQRAEAIKSKVEESDNVGQRGKADSSFTLPDQSLALDHQSKADTSSGRNLISLHLTQQQATNILVEKVQPAKDSVIVVQPPLTTSDSTITTTASMVAKKSTDRNKWEWGIQVNGGRSGIRNSFGSVFSAGNSQGYNAPINSNISPTAPTNTSLPAANDAFSYGLAVHVKKYIGKRHRNAVSFSVGYDHYTVTTAVGLPRTGTLSFNGNSNIRNEANQYYSISDSSLYRSSYHFIRIGANYQHGLSWLGKRELMLVGGIGVSRLIASNGLHLGMSNNTYYFFKNKSLFNRWQIDVLVGADLSINRSGSLQIGPRIQYMFTELSSQINNQHHLFRPGIQLNYWFRKKQ